MKIAVTAKGNGLSAEVDERFGRAACFVLYDTETKAASTIDNGQSVNAASGAGIQAAETVARAGIQCLITGHCGPKAFRTLSSAGIRVYNGATGTVADAIAAFEQGRLAQASAADVDSHW